MTSDIEEVFAALGDPTRRRIVELLRAGPQRAGALAERFDSSVPTISRHLRVLRRAGVLEVGGVEQDARARVYRLRPETFVALQAWVDQVQAQWRDQLTAFADHAERVASSGGAAPVAESDRSHPHHRQGDPS